MNNFANESVKIFKAFSDSTRYNMIKMLAKADELSCEEINNAFKLSKAAMSNHFKILENANLITIRKEGTYHFIRLNKDYLEKYIPSFAKIHK